jgi:hypothetical protein
MCIVVVEDRPDGPRVCASFRRVEEANIFAGAFEHHANRLELRPSGAIQRGSGPAIVRSPSVLLRTGTYLDNRRRGALEDFLMDMRWPHRMSPDRNWGISSSGIATRRGAARNTKDWLRHSGPLRSWHIELEAEM